MMDVGISRPVNQPRAVKIKNQKKICARKFFSILDFQSRSNYQCFVKNKKNR